MSLILGIDTGGTYTDGVIVERCQKVILHKAKSLTTKEDLTIGIENCIEKLKFNDFQKIELVCLSTTLATNAIVEGLGCKTGLLLIGGVPSGKLPVEEYKVIRGSYDIKGKIKESLQEDEVRKAIESFKGKVDDIVISGYASVRNSSHELRAKEIAREIVDIPIVCAHELTSGLGFHERTVTAVLNAKLIPIIKDLIKATKIVLQKRSINVPIMIVKGDGSLMKESFAEEKPIETILSGPAASIIGGTFLTDMKDALILDMGGTTTDIANVEKGTVKIVKDGAKVGNWLTRVNAAEICTFGIGGDSYLQLDGTGQLKIGPAKVCPLCVIGKKYPGLADEIKKYRKSNEYELLFAQETDCFMLFKKKPADIELSEEDERILSILQDGPHSIFYIANKMERDADALSLENLIDLELITRISLTPTDILHVQNRYTEWDRNISEVGVEIIASKLGKSVPEFLDMVSKKIIGQLTFACLQSLANFENMKSNFKGNDLAMYLINKAIEDRKEPLLETSFQAKKPIVAIGAPVSAWMHDVADRLKTTLIIPEHAEVANAIGAAVGKVMETVEVLIRPDKVHNKYVLHAPWERKVFSTLEDAKEYALEEVRQRAACIATEAGSTEFDIVDHQNDIYTNQFPSNKKIYIETRIKATAIGVPSCCMEN